MIYKPKQGKYVYHDLLAGLVPREIGWEKLLLQWYTKIPKQFQSDMHCVTQEVDL